MSNCPRCQIVLGSGVPVSGGRQEGGDGRQGQDDGMRSLFRGFDDKLFISLNEIRSRIIILQSFNSDYNAR